MKRQVIAITNQKGGAGKTTTAHNLAGGLFKKGFKVLMIDIDGQGNLSELCNADINKPTVMDLLTGDIEAKEAIQQTQSGDLIAGNERLFLAETQITEIGKEYKVKEILNKIKGYDFIILDTPPALSVLTTNALTAADFAIIPAQADILNIAGIKGIYKTIKTIQIYCNKTLEVKGILLTRHNERLILNKQIAEMLKKTAPDIQAEIFKTVIRENISIREAQANKQTIFDYAPASAGAADYEALTKEILK